MSRFRNAWPFIVVAALVLTMSVLCFAQAPVGSLRGTVTDNTGAVVPGAKVTITEVATGRTVELTTSDAGIYSAQNLAPGDYTVKVQAGNFAPFSSKALVQAGQVTAVSPKLSLGTQTTTVEVEAGATLAPDLVRSTVDGVIDENQIQNLPENSRNFLDLAQLEPGVLVRDGGSIDPTKSATFRTVGVDGRSGTGTRVQIDGIDVTDETVGTTLVNISNDAVKEFQLSQSTLDLSTSLTSSGAVNIISRSGSNAYHGSAFEFFRDNNLSARLPNQDQSTLFRRHQYGFRIGGPIVKDKLFWFANGEHVTQVAVDPSTIFRPAPVFSNFFGKNCAAGCVTGTPLDQKYLDGRLDYNITNSLHLFYRYNYYGDLAAGGDVPFSPFQNTDWTLNHVAGVDYTRGRFSHSYRFGYVNFNNRIISQSFAGFPFPVAPTGQPYYLNVGQFESGPNSLAPQQTDQDNFQNKYDGSFVFGKHTLRYGFEYNHIVLGGFANFAGPLSVFGDFASGSAVNPGLGTNDPNPLNYQLSDFQTGPNNGFFTLGACHGFKYGCHKNNRTAFYVGDTYKMFSNFTLNYGTRWEYDSGYFNKEGSNGVTRPAFLDYFVPGASKTPSFPKDKFGPQLGFAWDPFKDGKTSIRAGAYVAYELNIFNNLLFDQNALIPSGIGPDVFTSGFIGQPNGNPITPAMAGITAANLPASCQTAAATTAMNGGDYSCLTGNPINQTLTAIGKLDVALKAAYANYNFNPSSGQPQFVTQLGNTFGFLIGGNKFKLPYSEQFNIGIQRELAKNHVLSVDFLYNHGIHQGFLGQDLECRRCASTLNVAKAAAKINAVTGGLTVTQYLATHPGTTIGKFGLASDSIFQGRTPDPTASDPLIQTTNFVRARIVTDGGFAKYRALNVKLKGRFGGEHFFNSLKDTEYTISYALSRSEATGGSTRTEFLNNATDKFNPANPLYFGPTGLDHTHNLVASLTTQVPLGFHIGQIWSFRTPPPLSVFLPGSGQNSLFTTDLLGEGGSGSSPFANVLPGTKIGEFGRSINNIKDLNKVIANYNAQFAGKPTPAGAALVKAGLMTNADLVTMGAVTPTIALIPLGNPDPFENFFNLDMTVSRPIHLTKIREGMQIEPIVQFFNIFNNNTFNVYGAGLFGNFGDLNYDYNSAANNTPGGPCDVTNTKTNATVTNCVQSLQLARGRQNNNRQVQVGIRFTF